MEGSESGRIVPARRTRQDEWFGAGYRRLCFQPCRKEKRQIRQRSILDEGGENAQRELMFLGPREIGVVVLGGMAVRKMDVDDGAARVPGQVVLVIVAGLSGVQMQEWRGKECQKQGQPGGSRERSPHVVHC